MNQILLVCLIGAGAVAAAPTREESIEDLMDKGLKVMEQEGTLGQLSEKNEIQMFDFKGLCNGACAAGKLHLNYLTT